MALNRFYKFGYEYSQGFKLDLALDPVVIMRLVHPHFGYLNRFPNSPHLKYTHPQLCQFLQELIAISKIRASGHTLHSSELMSFFFWKILNPQKPRLSLGEFASLLSVFKFDVKEDQVLNEISYSLKTGDIKAENLVRFDVFRQLYLDRNL